MEPIKIKIENDLSYAYVALLVDRPDFLEDVELSRKVLGVSELIKYQNYGRWFKHLKKQQKEPLPPLVSTDIGGRVFIHSPEAFTEYEKILRQTPLGNFKLEVIRFAEKYKRHHGFESIIKKSIVCGEVYARDFMTAQLVITSSDEVGHFTPEEGSFLSTRRHLIEVTPYTTRKEVLGYLSMAKEEMGWRPEFEKEFSIFNILPTVPKHVSTEELHKTLSKIRRDRMWYWERQKKPPVPFKKLWDDWEDKCVEEGRESDDIYDINILEQAVTTYRDRLLTKI